MRHTAELEKYHISIEEEHNKKFEEVRNECRVLTVTV